MDERLNKLLENQKKQEDIEIAQNADRLLVEGSSDSDPSVAKLKNDGNIVRQIYSAIIIIQKLMWLLPGLENIVPHAVLHLPETIFL